MTQADFIVERLSRFPASAVARMAGCSVERVKAVEAFADSLPRIVPPPEPPPPPPPRIVVKAWRPSVPPLARNVLQGVAAKHDITLAELLSPSSRRRGPNAMARIRHEAWWELRAIRSADGSPLYSLPRIGDWFGGKDHTTILWGLRRHEDRMAGRNPPKKPYDNDKRRAYVARIRAEKLARLAEVHACVAWRESGRDL